MYVSSEDIFETNQVNSMKTRDTLTMRKNGGCIPSRLQHFMVLMCVNILYVSKFLRLLPASFSSLSQLRHFNFLMCMLR